LDSALVVLFRCFLGSMFNVKGFEVCNKAQLAVMMRVHNFPHFGHPVEQISYLSSSSSTHIAIVFDRRNRKLKRQKEKEPVKLILWTTFFDGLNTKI